MIHRIFCALLLAAGLFAPAEAQWREARTRHFLVYSEGGQDQLRDFAEKLEKFDFVLRAVHGLDAPPAANPVKVYLMRNMDAVAATLPHPASGILGYYEGNARGAIMVGTRGARRGSAGIDPEEVLLHEYAHHFMLHHFPATYPAWYVEGFAEFWGQTRILPDDVVEVGHASRHRLRTFDNNRWAPIARLLGRPRRAEDQVDVDLIYAQGWLLVHYLFANAERQGQLARYLNAINSGVPHDRATSDAFGDGARRLNDELYSYAGRKTFDAVRLPFRRIDVGPLDIRPLTPAEEALIVHDIQLGQGIYARYAAEFARAVRQAAARFPSDPYALMILAEAERAAGNGQAAAAAVDRLLQLAPQHPRGLMLRGALRADGLRASGSADAAAWSAARRDIVAANRLAPADPLILEAYYDSFVAQGAPIPDDARRGLESALDHAPGDRAVRFKLALDHEGAGRLREALATIQPLAFEEPHPGEVSERQRRRRERDEEKWREVRNSRPINPRELYEGIAARIGETATAAAD
jgi:tetratricopeptide (TPR) repeat protein